MTYLGADTDHLRDLSARMRGKIMVLQQHQMDIARTVATVPWEGPDAEAFRDRVMTEVSPTLLSSAERLGTMSDDLAEQASQQDDVSDPRGFWEKLNDLLHWPAQITRTIRNIQRIMTDIPRMLELFRDGKLGLQQARDLIRLRKDFPALAKLEYKAIAKEWDEVLNGKGWEKLGNFVPQKISQHLGINIPGKEWAGKSLSHLDEITDATKPWVKVGSKALGKFIPGVDIALGVHQVATGDAYDKFSGGLSMASGGLVLASPLFGPAAPIVAGVGVGLGVVSAGMDIGRTLYENVPAVKNTVDGAVNTVKDGAGAIGNGLKSVGDGFASVFG